MTSKKEKKLYMDTDVEGNKSATLIEYTLWFDDKGFLTDVTNPDMVSVDKKSDCWLFFEGKYNHL